MSFCSHGDILKYPDTALEQDVSWRSESCVHINMRVCPEGIRRKVSSKKQLIPLAVVGLSQQPSAALLWYVTHP